MALKAELDQGGPPDDSSEGGSSGAISNLKRGDQGYKEAQKRRAAIFAKINARRASK